MCIEQLIDGIKDSIDDSNLGYSGGQSVDRKYCPICGADDVIRYQTNQVISMGTLDHEEYCAYSLIRKLEQSIEAELTTLDTLKTEITDELESSRHPNANEFNIGIDRGIEIVIDRIENITDQFDID